MDHEGHPQQWSAFGDSPISFALKYAVIAVICVAFASDTCLLQCEDQYLLPIEFCHQIVLFPRLYESVDVEGAYVRWCLVWEFARELRLSL